MPKPALQNQKNTLHAKITPMPTVWIVGSAVLDTVQSVDALPKPGESVFVRSTAQFLGGKGSNQAVTAARMGASAAIVGTLGQDEAGSAFLASYSEEGLDHTNIHTTDQAPTGSASILIQPGGLNMIAINVGSNSHVTAEQILACPIEPDDYVLCQLEVPNPAVIAASTRGNFIFNPAPMRHDYPREVLANTFAITPNEAECEALTGIAAFDEYTASRAARELLALGPRNAIITLGPAGAFWASRDGEHELFPAPKVDAVDTTGAGDVFNGTLAARLSLGDALPNAIQTAIRAASLSTTKPGAIPSIPRASDLE